MEARIKNLADEMTAALGPIFQHNPKFGDIIAASALLMARIAQGRPEGVDPVKVLQAMTGTAHESLGKFLKLEDEKKLQDQAQKEVLERGVAGFAGFAKPGEPGANGLEVLPDPETGEAEYEASEEEAKDSTEVEDPENP